MSQRSGSLCRLMSPVWASFWVWGCLKTLGRSFKGGSGHFFYIYLAVCRGRKRNSVCVCVCVPWLGCRVSWPKRSPAQMWFHKWLPLTPGTSRSGRASSNYQYKLATTSWSITHTLINNLDSQAPNQYYVLLCVKKRERERGGTAR